MKKIRKGDIVARKSHGKDIIFYVKRIIKTENGDIAILNGIVERIEADCKIEDLEKIDYKIAKRNIEKTNEKLEEKIKNKRKEEYEIAIVSRSNSRINQKIVTGKILHLDGDKKYSQKSYNYYKKLGLNAIVKNIPEYKQPKVVYQLLKIYNPDILIITRTRWYDKKRNKL